MSRAMDPQFDTVIIIFTVFLVVMFATVILGVVVFCWQKYQYFMDSHMNVHRSRRKKVNTKLRCASAAVITALLMALSVFIGNVSHTEYKSQAKKRKLKRQESELTSKMLDDSVLDVSEVENV